MNPETESAGKAHLLYNRRINNQNPVLPLPMVNMKIIIIPHERDDIFRQWIKFRHPEVHQKHIPAQILPAFPAGRQYLPQAFRTQSFLQKPKINPVIASIGNIYGSNPAVRHARYAGTTIFPAEITIDPQEGILLICVIFAVGRKPHLRIIQLQCAQVQYTDGSRIRSPGL